MKIYVGFSTKKSLTSQIIKRVEGSEFSHVYLKFFIPEYDEWLIYHADNTMIHLLREERFLAKGSRIIEEYELEIPDEEFVDFAKSALKKSGIPYGFTQIMGMFAVRLMKLWFNVKIKNPLADGRKAQICSELIYYDLSKYVDFKDFEPEWDGPKELNKHIARECKRVR